MDSTQHQLATNFIDNVKIKMNLELEIATAGGHRNVANEGRAFVRFPGGGIIAWVDEFPLTPKQKIRVHLQLQQFKNNMDKVNASGLF
jgi:hypothetical protein